MKRRLAWLTDIHLDHVPSAGRPELYASVRDSDLLVLMHVAPFAEAAWHEGAMSNPDWLPFFACRAAGEALSEIAPSCRGRMTVLCGHTHGGGRCEVGGMTIITGPAEYGFPRVQQVIELR